MSELLSALLDIRSWPSNFAYNLRNIISTSDLKTVIRVVVILGGYMLLRPFILKLFAMTSMKNHESLEVMDTVMKGEDVDVRNLRGGKGVGANAFRDGDGKGGKGIEEEGDGDATGADWGKKAMKRQVAVEERRVREEEIKRKYHDGEVDDKDILDLLVDYEEGDEGW